jgi:hypothetical protein
MQAAQAEEAELSGAGGGLVTTTPVQQVADARRSEGDADWSFDVQYDRDKRKYWEELFVQGYLQELIPASGLAKGEISAANTRWKTTDGPFLVELKESFQLQNYTMTKRHLQETLLYSFRGEATLELLQQRVTARHSVLK